MLKQPCWVFSLNTVDDTLLFMFLYPELVCNRVNYGKYKLLIIKIIWQILLKMETLLNQTLKIWPNSIILLNA